MYTYYVKIFMDTIDEVMDEFDVWLYVILYAMCVRFVDYVYWNKYSNIHDQQIIILFQYT